MISPRIMERRQLFVVLLITASWTLLAAQPDSLQLSDTKLAAWISSLDGDDAEYCAEMCLVFSMAAPKYFKKSLAAAPDLRRFQERVDDWIRDNADQWAELKARLEYCRQLQAVGALATPVASSQRDVRWDVFLANGPPAQARILPIRDHSCLQCSIWTYTWLPVDSLQFPYEISCKSESEVSYPTEIIIPDREGFLSAYIIEPLVHAAHFPSREGRGELWFSIWVRGNELTRPTLDLAQLTIQVELYDAQRSKLITARSSTCDLQLLRGVLEATERRSRRFIRAMEYIVFPEIAAGSYQAHITVTGAFANEGDCWVDVKIAGQSRISDLLILHSASSSASAESPGIMRSARDGLCNNPEAVFAPGSTLSLYAEAMLPQGFAGSYEASVTLLPIPAVARSRKSTVELGIAIAVADSLERPLGNRAFHSLPKYQLDSLMSAGQVPSNSVEVFRRQFDLEESNGVLELNCPLSRKLNTGEYLLTLTVTDPKQQRFFLTTSRLIQIAKPGSWLSKF